MSSPIKHEETEERKWVSVRFVGKDYAEPLGLDPIEGRTFETARPADVNSAVVLTEKAVDTYGLTRNPVGQTITWGNQRRTVVGVVENFHNESLREPIRPVVLAFNPENTWTALVQLKPGASRDGLDAVRKTWNEFLPDRPFTYSFLDQQIEAQDLVEQCLITLFGLFEGLAIVVAGLGLFGLAAYSAQERTKDVGLRKALGATAGQIVTLLSKEFVQLVGLAVLIGLPVAYVALHRWLQDFAYRVELGAGVFVLTGVAALVVAGLTVSYQALRAARTDPATTLRDW